MSRIISFILYVIITLSNLCTLFTQTLRFFFAIPVVKQGSIEF